jgi:hypothetical protein
MAGAGVIGMGMGDDGAIHATLRVDEESAGFAVKALRQDFQPGVGMRHSALPV